MEVGVAIKRLDGRRLRGIKYVPVVDGALCNQAQGRVGNPLPEGDVLAHGGRLELLLLLQVENLEGP